MIDTRLLRDAPQETRAALARRLVDLDGIINRIIEADEERRRMIGCLEALKAERNRASEDVGKLKKDGGDATELLAELRGKSGEIKSLDAQLKDVESGLRENALRVPNIPLAEIPDGREEGNEILRTWGDIPQFRFEPRPHWDIGESLGLIDLVRGARIAGSGFPLYTGAGARLVRALQNFMLDLHVDEHGYTELSPPHLVTEEAALGTGQLPDLESNMYRTEDGLYLIPTAEVPVTNMHAGEILKAEQLPRTYVACTPCYRREAGAHGKDTRGIIRVHQFDKVELVRICEPEQSPAEFEKLLGHAETVLRKLEIPYRVLALAAGDIGFASAKTYDLEVWAAGVNKWLEVSSVSTFTDFQSRRAGIRYRPAGGGKPVLCHTLNASGVALPRTIIALLENNQEEDGSVTIPDALVQYLGVSRLTGASA